MIQNYFLKTKLFFTKINEFVLLGLLNSKLLNWYHKTTCYNIRIPKGSLKYPISFFENLPIPEISVENEQKIIEKVKTLLKLNNDFYQLNENFIDILKAEFNFASTNHFSERWFSLEWKEFCDEMAKLKSPVISRKQTEWIIIFKEEKEKLQKIFKQIKKIENEFDNLVFQLYHLTKLEEEIVKQK